ncbi:hypothetical protein F6Y02_40890 (plasmid) [Bacillus megaterium]|nr:hypothetical protein [Priestia megaterium]
MDIQNDIVAVWRNVVITRDIREQGWFKFSGFHTSFDSEAQLMAHFSELKRLFKEIKKKFNVLLSQLVSLSMIFVKSIYR